MEASVVLRAPAKLNLTLEVLERRADERLHALRSLMVPIDLYDEIEICEHPRFTFECDTPGLENNNLIVSALAALNLTSAPLRVRLRKRIPVGAGMGGGSSDAAAVLLAAQRGVFGDLGPVDYLGHAIALGSDVPFFLTGTAALVEGFGERVTSAGTCPRWFATVVSPPVAVSTSAAFERLDAAPRCSRPRNTSVSLRALAALQRAEFDSVHGLLQNDFDAVVGSDVPEVACALDALRKTGAKPLVTGSGSSVFALERSCAKRDAVADALLLPDGYRVHRVALISSSDWRTS
ncbi:MAG: 4-(cytidine 5'-diphospho)-2-C-methyl-D-erythritol kinase [Candidatus Eremiobacteraeota bacterium]|nr:4-(cytidine 5'-diphospho)-2-C-methyl-D-erythritol kinase [Candidatus Eremiobacteraeota bacterium]